MAITGVVIKSVLTARMRLAVPWDLGLQSLFGLRTRKPAAMENGNVGEDKKRF